MKKKYKKELTYTEKHTMYNLLPLMARTAVICIVPKAIDAVHDAFFKTKKTKVRKQKNKIALPMLETATKKSTYKKYDTTPFTQQHYDYIMNYHEETLKKNAHVSPEKRITKLQMIAQLNKLFGMHKGATSYARVYNKKINKTSLKRTTKPILVAEMNKKEKLLTPQVVHSFKDIKNLVR